ncbi:MAG: nucleotidyltransferase domain-containing protein [Candidatus Caldarchaeum sp.]
MSKPARSSNSAEVRVFKLDYDAVMAKVRDYARKLVDGGLAELVVLIGSLAKGTYTPFSDIDLVIVVRESAEKPVDRIPRYIDPSLPLDVEPLVFTVDEFIQTLRTKPLFAAEVAENGLFLAGDRSMLQKTAEPSRS